MIDEQKVLNFIQDFGCAKLEHLQILFGDKNSSFKQILKGNMVSKKGDVFVHNTRVVYEKMLIALDVLCVFKKKLKRYCPGNNPATITFITHDDLVCNIIVADKENQKGIVKLLNHKPLCIPSVDRLLVVFFDESEFDEIDCNIPIYYIVYPELEVIFYREKEGNINK